MGGGAAVSTIAPLEMRPAVGTPCETASAWPCTSNPVTDTGPCAEAIVCPSGPPNCVISSVPPSSDVASPIADTVTSMRSPTSAPVGSSAVTTTAATLRFLSEVPRELMPKRSIIDCIDCSVNGMLRNVSPVPWRPTTRP